MATAAVICASCGRLLAGLEDGDLRIQGDKNDLRGVASLAIQCEISGINLHLKGDGKPPVTTNDVTQAVSQQIEKAGLVVKPDAPTTLTIEFDTPRGTLTTYVNFIIAERTALLRDHTVERKIPIWMATGYERGQVYPEPVGRLTRALLSNWGEANGKKVDLPPEKKPGVTTVILLRDKRFSLNGKEYPHSELVDVVKSLPETERELVKVQSGWETRSDAGGVFKALKDAGFNAKIDFKLGDGGAEEQQFMQEWKKASDGKTE
jgi:hypothetical protein